MRDKEKLHDYRFLPDPNLPPLRLYSNTHSPPSNTSIDQVINIDDFRDKLLQLPASKREQLQKLYDITLEQSFILVVS